MGAPLAPLATTPPCAPPPSDSPFDAVSACRAPPRASPHVLTLLTACACLLAAALSVLLDRNSCSAAAPVAMLFRGSCALLVCAAVAFVVVFFQGR